jgi:hypothetical protein
MKKIIKRAKAPVPPFFGRLRNIGLVMAGVATAVLTAPVALPALATTVAGYLLTAGTVATAVSQLTVKEETGNHVEKGGEDGLTGQP